jgi:hypothetical protein
MVFVTDSRFMASAIRMLAVDVGLKTGFAAYNADGKLCEYFSRHFANRQILKKAAFSILSDFPELTHLVVEGGGELAQVWQKMAERRNLFFVQISAEEWRASLLFKRQQRNGRMAKQNADTLARQVIEWSGIARPTSLKHDAAEAVLIGLWAVWRFEWLQELPPRFH